MNQKNAADTPPEVTEKNTVRQTENPAALSVRLLEERDLPVLLALEQEAFPDPWSMATWQRERQNALATWLVAETADGATTQVIGYGGIWLVAGEAQVMRVAVRKNLRGRGLGLRLARALLIKAWELGAEAITLEVRESNQAARAVYEKCGFTSVGIRPHYYEDNHEGAVIMWLHREQQTGAADLPEDGEKEP